MKKYLIPLVLLFGFACTSQKEEGFIISGEIAGKTPALVYLKAFQGDKETVVDSSEFVNGKFKFKGKVELPKMYHIVIGDNQYISFFVENSSISIKAHIDSLHNATVIGSKTQDEYLAYKSASSVFSIEMMKIYKAMKSSTDEILSNKLSVRLDSLYEAQMNFTKAYVKANNKSIVAPFLISRKLIHTLDLSELEQLTGTLSVEVQNSEYTQILFKRIDLLRTLQPGNIAPAFSQNDTAGNSVSLSDFKGKYLLIDFWASWCSPCRKANPEVVKVFNKYKSNNFTILGVSMDSEKDAWLKAITEDGLLWTQVSALKGWKNPVGEMYGVNGIPHGVLIDPDGNIIKTGIHPDKLDEILSELLK